MDINKMTEQWQEVLVNRPDFMREMVQECVQYAMQEAFNKFIGADAYQRGENRNGQRNGYYERELKTRVGAIDVQVCRDREGNFQHDIFERYRRSEKALVLTVAQMYFSGVSTRKVEGIMHELCGMKISKSQVSDLVKQLDVQLLDWRNRSLAQEIYQYVMFDARYEKVRDGGRVISKAFVTAIGITQSGMREIIGCWVINSESYEAWDACLQELRARGLHGVQYVVSDENSGLRSALAKHFQGVVLQRCQVHYMRNFLGKFAKSEQGEYMQLLRDVFNAPTRDDAMERFCKLTLLLSSRKKESVVVWLEETIDDALAVFDLPAEHRKKMRSTNMLERFNQELKRRSRVVRIFPDDPSCLRLLATLCQETSDEWSSTNYLMVL